MLHNVVHGVLFKYQNEGVVRNLSKKVQLTKIYGLVFIATAFFSSAVLAPVQPAGAASVTITTTKISPAQKPVSLTGSSFVVNYCNEDKDGSTNDCDNGITPVTFNKEGGKFIARDVDYSHRTSLFTRNTCNYNINVWYGANSSTANLTPEYRGGGPCSQFSERSIAVIPANITLAPPAKIQVDSVYHALYIPSDHPPVDISGNSISLKFCQLDTLNENFDNTTRPTTSACPSVGTVTLYKQGDAFVENSIDISGAPYTCNYGLRAVIGQGAGNVTISKNGGDPCPDGVDDGNTTFTISSASMCESKYPAGSVRDACMAGALDANKANDAFCDETYADKPAEIAACKTGQEATKNIPPPDAAEPTEAAPTCTVEAVGWIICPVTNFLAKIVDGAYGLVEQLLVFTGFTSAENSSMRSAWEGMRNIANVFFVVGFLIIVFSQVTSIGISNYGIKKLLPKLIITAILVNLSYTLCALAVDVSNLLGGGMKDLFTGFEFNAKPNQGIFSGGSWLDVAGGLLAGTLAVGVSLYVGLSALLPALIAAIVSIVTAFLVLTLRQALIILLIVISPLAIVAMLLPNTENWFKKWKSTFMTMLLIYPIIGLLFGASALASSVITNSSDDFFVQIMGALIGVLPLAITPVLLKASGGILGKFGAMINNPNKGPFDRMRKGAERIRQDAEGRRGIRALNGGRVLGRGKYERRARREAVSEGIKREQKRAQSDYISQQVAGSEEFRNRVAGGSRGRYLNADQDAMQRALDNAEFTIQQADVEEAKAASARIDRAVLDQDELRTVGAGGTVTKLDQNGREQTFSGSNSAVRTAAWGKMAEQQDLQGLNDVWDSMRTSQDAEARKQFADVIGSMQGRPAWFSQGALQGMRLGNAGTVESLIDTAITSNAYSAEKIVKSDRSELAIVADRASSTGNTASLISAATTATSDPQLSRAINKNTRQIAALQTGTAGVWAVDSSGNRTAR